MNGQEMKAAEMQESSKQNAEKQNTGMQIAGKTETGRRRSSARIVVKLLGLLGGKLSATVGLAVLNGSAGFLCAMGVTFWGAVGIAKALGENISLSYGWITALCIGSGLLRGGLRYIEQYSNHYIAFRLLAVLRDKIFGKLRELCPAKLEDKEKGSLIAMITADIETLEMFYAHTISPVCIAVIVSVIVMVVIGVTASWYLSLCALLAYLCIGLVLPFAFSGRMKKTGVAYRQEFSSFGAYFLDSIKGIREIVLYGAGRVRSEEVDRRSDRMLAETRRLKKETAVATAVTEFTVSFFVILTLLAGLFLLSRGELSLGRLVIGVVAVYGSFGPVIAISALPGNLTQTFASGDRVLNLLEETPVVEPVTDGKDFVYENLSVEHLSFGYEKTDGQEKKREEVLTDCSLQAKKGEIIGIIGESGSGKSTLLKLMLRFFPYTEGKIYYNGIPMEEINTDSLLGNVSMVSQSTYLFDNTIAENLRIAKPDATEQELWDACEKASLKELIASLPEGLDTPVGLAGGNFSAGERQRMGLARAFLSGSSLILLDEPTSNVDSINEGIILKALLQQKKDKTIILVSHRDSTMSVADKVYRMNGGVLQEVL